MIEGIFLFIVAAGFTVFCASEFFLHRKNLYSIPIRVHVNGTRGKSSVTRLIAAGLREGGRKTFAKTTGSLPRVISHDGNEYPVYRPARPNIIEQLRVVAFAAKNRAEALVIECMALQPVLQLMSEEKLINATIGVITNAREDHLDIMGPTEKDVALALLGTVPERAVLFTCEKDYMDEFQKECEARNSRLVTVGKAEIGRIKDKDMRQFSYVEHRENVALALGVCEHLGVPRLTALRGMHKVKPDIGAMKDLALDFFGRKIFFVNGFAANDPESTKKIWEMAIAKHRNTTGKIMVVNTRIDRPDRSRQFGEALVGWPAADKYILIGSGSYFLVKHAVRNGINPNCFIDAEELKPEAVFEEILKYCEASTLVMGVGNIAGPGLELIKYFSNRSVRPAGSGREDTWKA